MQANTVFTHGNKTYAIGEDIKVKEANGDILITGKELKELRDKGLVADDVVGRLKKEATKKAKDLVKLKEKEDAKS